MTRVMATWLALAMSILKHRTLINGDSENWQDRTIFLHSQNITQYYEKWKKSLLATEKWRLAGQNELYDIKSEPAQENNIAEEYPGYYVYKLVI